MLGWQASPALAAVKPFDFSKVRAGYLDRLAGIRKQGILPILDVESSCDPTQINLESFTRSMDRAGIGVSTLVS